MKFQVIRTSQWKSEKPCEEAVKRNDIWVIELNTLEDLINFVRKYGDVVIYESMYKEYPYTIEIYDYYRE